MKNNSIRDMAHIISELKKISARNKSKSNNEDNDFLSMEEVDALLRGITGESDDDFDLYSSKTKEKNRVTEYNLGTQERIIRGRMPTLELINERFARNFRIEFFNKFRRSVEMSVGPIRVHKYSEFVRNLVVPTNINMIGFNNTLPGVGLIIFDPNLVFLTVDNVFGGDGRFHTRVEGRDFTHIEQMVIMELLNVFISTFTACFKPVYDLEMTYIRSEMNSQFAGIATPSEVVVSTTFTVEMSGSCADMHICIPYSSYEKIRPILNSTLTPDIINNTGKESISLTHITHNLDIRAELLDTITISDIRKLKSGDTISFDTFNAYIEDKHIFQGEYAPDKFTITNIKEK